jgi:hypothetical protein
MLAFDFIAFAPLVNYVSGKGATRVPDPGTAGTLLPGGHGGRQGFSCAPTIPSGPDTASAMPAYQIRTGGR